MGLTERVAPAFDALDWRAMTLTGQQARNKFDSDHRSRGAGESEHFVQFYEDETYLIASLTEFVRSGLENEEACLVIATRDHLKLLEDSLANEGIDVRESNFKEFYYAVAATEALGRFMVNGWPDKDLFITLFGQLISKATGPGQSLRAFGEMVSVLWKEGKSDAALRLEELWNELARMHAFTLMCAYPMSHFRGENDGRSLLEVCGNHHRIIPAESFPIHSEDDEQLRAITILQQKAGAVEHEISGRKKAEAEKREQQTRLQIAVELAQMGIWEIDLLTRAFHCSTECRTHFGAQDENLNYQGMLKLIHPDDRTAVDKSLQTGMVANSDIYAEFRTMPVNGEYKWIAVRGRCFHNGTHRMLGVSMEITARKRNAEMLEQTVRQRTAELQRTIGELEAFSYSISHDMRAPLRSMRSFADILLDECADSLNEDCRGYLHRIAAAGERMDRLIQDVLTFSRVSRTELKLEPVNLDHLIRGILECYPNLQAPAAEITIEHALPVVSGNAAALTQCFSNLLGNAVKFVPRGTLPKVRIWSEQSPGEPSAFRICIQDNGIGIPVDARDRIFGIFQRLNHSYEGTGIGLSIVKKAMERMGGRVGLESKEGNGSTFWLEIKRPA